MALGWRPNFPTVGLTGTELNAKGDFTMLIIIIIIIKICSAHISTLLGAQGAETETKHEYKQFTVIQL